MCKDTQLTVCIQVTQINIITHISVHINKYKYSYMCIYNYNHSYKGKDTKILV